MWQLRFRKADPKLRKWAADHAYSLIFITLLFIITWVIDILLAFR